jgi:glycosyltransferase involved in cell wall biosynthesis
MIKFSVVIPLYNKEKEIKDTISSVLNQSYPADEIIVVNDGSTDNSLKVVQENFANKVKIITQQNQGVSVARNSGIEESKNEYICFLDADDLWERDFLKEIKYLIENYPDAIFYSTSHKMIDENGNIIYPKIPKIKGYIENFFKVFKNNYGLINSSSVCVKKNVFQEIQFPEVEKRGEDLCVWLELSLKGKLAFSPKPLSIYKLNATNRSGEIHKEPIIPAHLKWFCKNREKLKNTKYYEDIKKFIHSNIMVNAYGMALERNKKNVACIINYMKANHDYFYLALYPALWMPLRILNFVRKIRRKLR